MDLKVGRVVLGDATKQPDGTTTIAVGGEIAGILLTAKEAQRVSERITALEKALRATVQAMTYWGSQEDGVPDECWKAYQEARHLLGMVEV